MSIFLAHRPAGREIGSINGKTSDGFAHGSRKGFEREVAIPAVLLGKPIEHAAQNIDIVRQRQLGYLQFLGIDQMPKRQGVTDETMERLCDSRFG